MTRQFGPVKGWNSWKLDDEPDDRAIGELGCGEQVHFSRVKLGLAARGTWIALSHASISMCCPGDCYGA